MIKEMGDHLLTLNAGSSSIKFALYEITDEPREVLKGVIEKIGWPSANLFVEGQNGTNGHLPVQADSHSTALGIVCDWLKNNVSAQELVVIGHRIVHGGPKYFEPVVITDRVLEDLNLLVDLDSVHLPLEIELVRQAGQIFPNSKQVAVFDTGFHKDLPKASRLLPIPRRYEKLGLRRYGFHGLSCSSAMKELARRDESKARGRVIIAHLGNGVSLTAVKDGKSLDTTMSLTPASGVVMSTRSGDLDPSLAFLLAKNENMDARAFNEMVSYKSGLLGISEMTDDMESLLAAENDNPQAKDAIEVFCYQVKKSIGALSATLGGLDALVFTGGMGEKSPTIRARVCHELNYLGIEIDQTANNNGESVISSVSAAVSVHTIHTDEESEIASQSWRIVKGPQNVN